MKIKCLMDICFVIFSVDVLWREYYIFFQLSGGWGAVSAGYISYLRTETDYFFLNVDLLVRFFLFYDIL